MDLAHFRFEIDADGVALLTWDAPGRSMNVITQETMRDLAAVIDRVAGDPAIKGCVIVSGKKSFSGGADLVMIEDLSARYAARVEGEGESAAAQGFLEDSSELSRLYRRLETCGKPFAAAIDGVCLGGAFELALACHYRVVSDDPATRVGLPEVKVGLFPGAGGTQRVARLMKTADALQMLLKGEQLRPQQARTMNLVHEIAPRAEIVESARNWIRGGGNATAPWDERNFRLPSGPVYSPAGMTVWPAANALYRRETSDNYPAAKAILHAVFEGLQLPMDLALKVESRWFAHILRSPQARAMIRTLFVSMGEIRKGARRPDSPRGASPRVVGVIGAGFMGGSIAYVSALAGFDVVLIDRDHESAERGWQVSHKLMSEQIARGRARVADRDGLLARIEASDDYGRLAACDLVIEAVFEDRDAKAQAMARAGAVMRPEAVFASNTSTLPIGSLADAFVRQQDVVGLHFFSPVERMALVEVIRGAQTSDRAAAMAFDFARAIGKTPIVVNDGRGFFANRCVLAFVREGHLMLAEGVPPAMIENLARMAGMPVGPLALNDEVAIDLAWRILEATKADLGADAVDPRQARILAAMVERDRLGRKNGKGFYDYPEKGSKRLWSGLAGLQDARIDPEGVDRQAIMRRFLAIQSLEAARVMEEGVLVDPREADIGSILGFGFAPFTGGVLSYVDGMGAARFVAICEDLARAHGPRFEPCALLREMAVSGETFYGRFAPARAAA